MNIEMIVKKQRGFFNSNATKSYAFRKAQLQKLEQAIKDNEQAIFDALKKDLNKSEYEAYLTEIGMVLSEIHSATKHLKQWMKPNKKKTPFANFPAKSYTIHEPYGVALILSPWNYPFQLAFAPVVGAIAAGNCVVLKCSKNSVNTSQIIAKIISETFDEEYVYCVDTKESYEEVLAQKYDTIFFTGSERVGKIVMRAASENVTPITLELGGKSPCFVDSTANIDIAAKRIIWGKLLNSGQTCVAPDYVLVDAKIKDKLIAKMQEHITTMYQNPMTNADYPKIISDDHFERLTSLIEREGQKLGGESNESLQKIAPAIFPNTTFESEIMQDEIFGPILPIIAYSDVNEIITTVKARPKPLACYIFTEDKAYSDKIIAEVSFGGGCINDVVMHLVNHNIPFGGVGSSGMGGYHGKYSFDTFSHEKSILNNKTIFDIPLRYAPFQMKNLPLVRKSMK